jgi:hypothetical protein
MMTRERAPEDVIESGTDRECGCSDGAASNGCGFQQGPRGYLTAAAFGEERAAVTSLKAHCGSAHDPYNENATLRNFTERAPKYV